MQTEQHIRVGVYYQKVTILVVLTHELQPISHWCTSRTWTGSWGAYIFRNPIASHSLQLGLRQGYSFPGTPWTHPWRLVCSRPGCRRSWKGHPCLPI